MSSPITVQGSHVIVIGGGLAGLSAAHTIIERGGRVLVLDKKEFLGGNSVKATSGINGALTSTQIRLGIKDSKEIFEQDTTMSAIGTKNPANLPSLPHSKVLTHNSGPDVEWLMNNFGLDLSLVSRLGGHSQPRTHRGKERFPGMTITYALMEKFDDIAAKEPQRAQVITLARATRLLTNQSGAVTGVEFEKNGQKFEDFGPVIIATGGFGADFGSDSLLAQYRPDLLHLPSTNGDHCTGDGVKMTAAIGGGLIDMKAVQVHPTGLVHPSEPDAKIKFLAAEALRGVGGLLLTKDGKRFSDELGKRDYVTGEMWSHKAGPYRLVLNSKGVKEIEWHCKHYVGRGLMKPFASGAALAKEMGISVDTLKQTFQDYNKAAETKNDPFGKRFFPNAPFDVNDSFHVAIVTPVVHYCMGGVQIDGSARIVRADDATKPIAGLYGAGECAGGVHGKNRLGGSGLLGCVVYGRVAGNSAVNYLFDQLSVGSTTANNRLGNILSQLTININLDQSGNVSVSSNQQGSQQSSTTAGVQSTQQAPVAPPKQPAKEYTLEEVAKHNTAGDCWVVVNGEVLNCTPFLEKHPGGKEAIMLFAGKDASAEFNMIHKPDVVAKYAPDLIVGTVKK